MSIVFQALFLLLGFFNFSYANDDEVFLQVEDEPQESEAKNLVWEKEILELERILKTYSMESESTLFFGNSFPYLDENSEQNSQPVLGSEEIKVEFLDPIPSMEIKSSEPSEQNLFFQDSLLEKDPSQAFKEILEKEKNYLKEKEEFKKFLNLYHFLKTLKPSLYDLRELQHRIDEVFLDFNLAVLKNNQIDRKIEEFNKRYKNLEDKRGNLSFIEIEGFIDFKKDKEVFSTTESLKEASKQTITYIRSLYDQIDLEKERLLNLGSPIVSILCDSQFYKSSQSACLPVFDLRDRKKLDFFIDSLSVEKWQELEKKTRETMGDSNYERDLFLKESLGWLAQDSELDGMKTLFKTTDFFRWVYFSLREELKAGVDPESSFSWTLIVEKLEEEERERENLELDSVKLSFEEKQIETEIIFYSNQMQEKEEEYFDNLRVIPVISSVILEIDLENTEVSCLELATKTAIEWSHCIEKYFNFLSFQEDLKDHWEKQLHESLKELIASASFLKSYLEKETN